MNHRTVIKGAIVVVILVTVVWSIVNVSEYAHKFHSGLVVWTLGASVGTANALSVYAFVIAKTRNVRVAAVAGVILFGAMSGALQTLLYIGNGAPLVAALAFGWFGPVAEGVLSWLHAVLSEEQTTQHKAKASNVKQPSTVTPVNVKQVSPLSPVDSVTPVNHAVTDVMQKGDTEIARQFGVSRQSVYKWRTTGVLGDKLAERLPVTQAMSINGAGK